VLIKMINAGANFRSTAFIKSVFNNYYDKRFNLIIKHLIMLGYEFDKLGSVCTDEISEDEELASLVRNEAVKRAVRDQLLIIKLIQNRLLI